MRDLKKILSAFAFTAFFTMALGFVTINTATAGPCDEDESLNKREYAVCNVYCEVMNCDALEDSDGTQCPNVPQKACDQILETWTTLVTDPNDGQQEVRPLPCRPTKINRLCGGALCSLDQYCDASLGYCVDDICNDDLDVNPNP